MIVKTPNITGLMQDPQFEAMPEPMKASALLAYMSKYDKGFLDLTETAQNRKISDLLRQRRPTMTVKSGPLQVQLVGGGKLETLVATNITETRRIEDRLRSGGLRLVSAMGPKKYMDRLREYAPFTEMNG